jgi:hypothetical protein
MVSSANHVGGAHLMRPNVHSDHFRLRRHVSISLQATAIELEF